jgi:hypothetical protein
MPQDIHLVGNIQKIDMNTGEVLEEKQGAGMLLPPKPGTCNVCATKHEPELPHNRDSLYYQMAFQSEHGRWPTWADAMTHCSVQMQETWRKLLRERGVTEDDIGVVQGNN